MNDFLVLTISYYSYNNIELLIFGILLLVGSIICVLLNRTQQLIKNSGLLQLNTEIINTLKYSNFFFLRKQNLHKQALSKPNIRVFKKKK